MRNKFSVKGLLGLTLAGFAGLAVAADRDYLEGYGQGVLDAGFGELELRAAPAATPEAIVVSGSRCLSSQQKQAVARTLTASPRLASVTWRLACPADDGQIAAASQPRPAGDWLPRGHVFRPLQADPREPRFAISVQEYDNGGREFTAGDFSVGQTFGFYRGHALGGQWQVGITGGVFSALDLDATNSDIFNVDYLAGFPLTYRNGDWSTRLRYFHFSSHLTDEYIFNNRIRFEDRLQLSHDAFDLLVGRDWRQLRLYGGGGYLIRSTEDLAPKFLQAGLEWRNFSLLNGVGLALAADVKAREELDWDTARSLQAALVSRSGGRELHYYLEYHSGKSPNGQFFYSDAEYYGLGFRFGL